MKKTTQLCLNRVIRYCTPYIGILLLWNGAIADTLPVIGNDVSPADEAPIAEMTEVQVTGKKDPLQGKESEGYRVGVVSLGSLGETPLQDVPYSISTVSADLIRNMQATNTTEAIKYLPTIQSNTGGSQITPYFTIRGLSASTWTYNNAVNGVRSFDIYEPLEDKERIEVLSGVNSFLYGITSPAGIINYVLKRPTEIPMLRITTGTYDQQFLTHLDAGGPIKGIINDKLSYRLNLLYGTPGDTGVAHQSQERYLVSSVLDYKANSDTKVSLDASWTRRILEYAQALFMPNAASGIPAAPDTSKNWGAPWTSAVDATTRVGVQANSHLSDIFSLGADFHYSDISREYFLNRQVWQNAALDYRWRVDSHQPFHTQVLHYGLHLDADFTTGPFRHRISLVGGRDDYDSGDNGYRGTTYATIYSSNLYSDPSHPAYSQPPKGTSGSQKTSYDTTLLVDRIGLGERWSLLVGGAWSRINDSSTSTTSAGVSTTTSYDRDAFTPTVALGFKPVSYVNTYVSYGEGLQQGFTAPAGSANAGEVFGPFVSRQIELGAKADLWKMNLAMALFRIEQANQYTTGSGSAIVYSQDGEVVNQGVEFTLTGSPLKRLTLTGGLTLLDAKVEKSATAGQQGKVPQGVAEVMGRIYAEYALPFASGLVLTGGLSYNGKTWVDAANTLSVPSVVIADAGLRYERKLFGRDMTMRMNIANLTGENYWTTRSGILYPGSPRIVSVSVTVALF